MLNAAGDSVVARQRMFAMSLLEGGSAATLASSIFRSSPGGSRPLAVSSVNTSWPRPRRIGTTWAALAMETSRSSLVPPNSTAIFMGFARLESIWDGAPLWHPACLRGDGARHSFGGVGYAGGQVLSGFASLKEDDTASDRHRIDKWLWCARFFKTR